MKETPSSLIKMIVSVIRFGAWEEAASESLLTCPRCHHAWSWPWGVYPCSPLPGSCTGRPFVVPSYSRLMDACCQLLFEGSHTNLKHSTVFHSRTLVPSQFYHLKGTEATSNRTLHFTAGRQSPAEATQILEDHRAIQQLQFWIPSSQTGVLEFSEMFRI